MRVLWIGHFAPYPRRGGAPQRSYHLLREAAGNASVRTAGFVEDVRPLVSSATLYVCPILDGGGTRLKLLDAMPTGKRIVATPVAAEGVVPSRAIHGA
jgi:hypothetical protein